MIGIQNGALLQRNANNTCEIYLLTEQDTAPAVSRGTVTKINACRYCLTGIPVGGPYELTVTADGVTQTYTDLYVGDLWLLGGQSNMEGCGVVTAQDREAAAFPMPTVRAFYMDDVWGAAVPLLHNLWKSADPCIYDLYWKERKDSSWAKYDVPGQPPYDADKRGVGPGYGFAKAMTELTGVPQGVIPCAVGGTSMIDWSPDAENPGLPLYAVMLRRFKAAGGHVRGLYWDQGESECNKEGIEKYVTRMQYLVSCLRRDTGDETLPVVINQIASMTLPWINDKAHQLEWSAVRELQRTLPNVISNTAAVPTLGAGMSDRIHKNSPSQHAIGRAAAYAMADLCGMGGAKPMTLVSMRLAQNETVPMCLDLVLEFANVVGELRADGEPSGISIQLEGDEPPVFWPNIHLQNLVLRGNTVIVHSEVSAEQFKSAYLWYGIGLSAVCNITDAVGRRLLAMGPVAIKDYLK